MFAEYKVRLKEKSYSGHKVPCGVQGALERVRGEAMLPCTELVGTLSDLWCLLARGLEILSFARSQDCTTLSLSLGVQWVHQRVIVV